jgi:nucleotide-binding universal stress UspA family protein
MGTIVVGYDGSDCANAALEKAADLAKRLGDNVVLVFGYAPHGPGGGEVPTQREAVKELAEKLTAEGMERAKAAGVEAEVELEPKHPAHALTDVAAEWEARMIVVGSHGESPLRGAILGLTPYKLLHGAGLPVLVVPAEPVGLAAAATARGRGRPRARRSRA